MRNGKVVLAVATLIAAVPQIRSQVLSPPEIVDPAMRALQQKHLPGVEGRGSGHHRAPISLQVLPEPNARCDRKAGATNRSALHSLRPVPRPHGAAGDGQLFRRLLGPIHGS